MGDDITIGVTEIVNNIEVTAQPNDQIVDISVIDNADDVTLNITPTVIEINVNKGSSYAKWGTILGTLSDQTDLQDALDLKADLVDGKVPSSQLPSYVDDVIEVANYAALPVVGESGKIYITLDDNHIFRWTGSIYVEITDNTAVWGAITGTLSSQSDLQSALNAKVPYTGATGNVNLGEYGLTSGYVGFDTTPTGTPSGIGTMYWDTANRTVSLIDGDGDTTLQIGQEERILVHNNTGSTLTDGQVVYVTGSTGELPSVSLANASNESTSATTIGVVTESIANGADGFITTSGLIHGLNTLAFTEGDLLWLGTTAGTYTNTKPTSPNHLVLIGYVIKKAGGNGSILVKIQNTQELDECSDVLFSGLANNDLLVYETASALWKNKSLATVLGYTPANDSNVVHKTGNESIAGWKTFTGGITIWDNTSSNLLDFYVNGTEIGSINVGTSYMQFSALNSGGYLFKNNAGVNSLTLTNSGVATFLNSVTATSFIKSGGTSSQFLKADGSVDSTSYQPLLTNPITGSLTTNYIPKATGSNVLGNSLIYDNGTNVGIGTTSPLSTLHIKSSNPNQLLLDNNGEQFTSQYFANNGTTKGIVLWDNTSTLFKVGTFSANDLTLVTNFTERVRVTSGGNVGIGTTSPAQKLDVFGTSRISNTTPTQEFYSTGNGDVWGIVYAQASGTGSGASLVFSTKRDGNTATDKMIITQSGNVGIGTTSPDNGKLTILKNTSNATESSYGIAIQSNTSNVYTELLLGADDTVDCGVIQTAAKNTSFTSKKLALQPNGGNVGIGTTSPSYTLHVNGSVAGTSAYNNLSDKRYKKDILPIENALGKILALNGVTFNWDKEATDMNLDDNNHIGLLAQDVEEIVPQAVTTGTDENETKSVAYTDLVPVLIEAIKELKVEIDLLKQK